MQKKTLIVVTGGREYQNVKVVRWALKAHLKMAEENGAEFMVMSGGARGLDQLAIDWCVDNGIDCIRMPAKWDRDGKTAGFKRNQAMVDLSRTFWRDEWNVIYMAFPGGNGTEDMKRRMKAAVHTFHDSGESSGRNRVIFTEAAE